MANPVETAYLSFRDLQLAFQPQPACPSAARKSGSSHLFGVGPGEADKTAFVQELSKSHNFFVLGLILVKFHIRTRLIESFPTMYRFWKCCQEKLHFTPVHTLRKLKPNKALFPPLRRVIQFRARYGYKTARRFGGWAKFGLRATHG